MINPCDFKRIFANFPGGWVEKISMHAPLGNLSIFLTNVRDTNKRRHQKGRRRSVGEDDTVPI
jgi:hypothetical protein